MASMIKRHPHRRDIEVRLAAKVPLKSIAEKYGVSIFAASRHRSWMKVRQRGYYAGLKRALARKNINARNFA